MNLEGNIVNETFVLILCGILGFQIITIIDRVWFAIDYKKAEKGLEVLEHYHYGLALMTISFIFIDLIPFMAFILLGMGAAFIYHESKQKNYFAHKSTHFKGSTIIGLVLMIIGIFTYFYLQSSSG